MEGTKSYVAVDLGAGSGRVILGTFQDSSVELEVLHRFQNPVAPSAGHDRWSSEQLFASIKAGLQELGRRRIDAVSVGVDTWGVDYGLLNERGELCEEPVSYRDARTDGVMPRVFAVVPRAEIYRRTGIQFMPLNTLFQLFAHRHDGPWPKDARRLLLMPDLFHFLLSGEMKSEYTIASTSQMLDFQTREWDRSLLEQLGIPRSILPELVQPGTQVGVLLPRLQRELGLSALKVVAPAAHDTASAVAATSLAEGWAYISSGTWSLVGIESKEPIVTGEAERENFTNEGGVSGTVRFLKNCMGLWILECCRKEWEAQGLTLQYEAMSSELASTPADLRSFIAPDAARFFHPSSMLKEITACLRESAQASPTEPILVAKLVLESLALRYATIVGHIERITDREVTGLRIIGGGSQNDYLNQATANACGIEVQAGPAEATALGNLLIQALADDRFHDLHEGREFLMRSVPVRRFLPTDRARWSAALVRFQQMERKLADSKSAES